MSQLNFRDTEQQPQRKYSGKELKDYKDQLERDKAIVTAFENLEMEQEKATRKKSALSLSKV